MAKKNTPNPPPHSTEPCISNLGKRNAVERDNAVETKDGDAKKAKPNPKLEICLSFKVAKADSGMAYLGNN